VHLYVLQLMHLSLLSALIVMFSNKAMNKRVKDLLQSCRPHSVYRPHFGELWILTRCHSFRSIPRVSTNVHVSDLKEVFVTYYQLVQFIIDGTRLKFTDI